jgi:oxygen-independent coproporphyrinogen-3 oxidase
MRYVSWAAGGDAVGTRREVAVGELPFEFMLNALRLTDGFPGSMFQERTGLAVSRVEAVLDAAAAQGLIRRDRGRIAPTALGLRFLDDLVARFLPE